MFDYFINNKTEKLVFLQKKPFTIFKIENFLSDSEYNYIDKNFPKSDKNFFQSTDQRLSFDSEDNFEIYKQKYQEEELVRVMHEKIYNINFFNYFLKQLKHQIIASKLNINDIILLLKLLKNKKFEDRLLKKNENFLDFLFYTKLRPSICYSHMKNNTQLVPHTDTRRKILSMMLYFPQEYLTEEQKKSLGTVFYNSNQKSRRKSGHQKGDLASQFKKNFKEKLITPFEKKTLYGFIRNQQSWHSVEKVNIPLEDFTRRTMVINLYI